MTVATDQPYSWLNAGPVRIASDIALGCVLLGAGAVAILTAPTAISFSELEGLDAHFFPTVVGGLLLAVGIVLLVRGSFFGGARPGRWSLKGIPIILAAIVAICAAAWALGFKLLLSFGPAEYAALIVLGLAVAIALTCRSRIQSIGMALLGLLLTTVGLDVVTGIPRFTMDLEQLFDGISSPIAFLGLFVVGDSLVCLVSPSLWLATYARLVDGWAARRLPTIAAIGMRVAAVFAIAAACYLALELEARIWDIGLLVLFGVFGLASKLFGWNRLLLLVALVYGTMLEENIRQSMLLSKGDLAVFWGSPINATLLLLAGGTLALAALLSARRALSRPNERGAEQAS